MKTQKIKTVSHVRVGERLLDTQDLNASQKIQLGTWLKCTYLNHLFPGQAVFHPREGEG